MTLDEQSGISGTPDRSTNEVVFTIPVGNNGISYRHLDAASTDAVDDEPDAKSPSDPGAPPWGPAALTIIQGSEGLEFIIGDAAGRRVVQFSEQGALLAERALDEEVVGTDDLQIVGQELVLLDQAAESTQLFRFALPASDEAGPDDSIPFRVDSAAIVRIALAGDSSANENDDASSGDDAGSGQPIRIGEGITGLAADDQGVLIEYGNGLRLFRPMEGVADPTTEDTPAMLDEVPGYSIQGEVYSTGATDGGAADAPADDAPAGDSSASIMVGGRSIPIPGTNVRGVRFLGAGSSGTFYVVAEEVSGGETIQVDQTVRQFAADGTQTGIARVPLAESMTYVPNGLAVGPDGAVYALVTRRDAVEVQRLVFGTRLSALQPSPTSTPVGSIQTPTADAGAAEAAANDQPMDDPACRSRQAMIDMGFHYRDNKVNLSNANLNGACAGRTRPRYLNKGPGMYGSVAYDWGGFDTVEQYNTFMAQARQAGDIPSGRDDPPTPCSKGVDCSGFVSRCWGLLSKEGTGTIHRVSRAISRSELKPGDILNLAGSHVTLYHHEDGEGVWAFESTTWGERDRVIFRPRPWSFYKNFEARRFNNVCPE